MPWGLGFAMTGAMFVSRCAFIVLFASSSAFGCDDGEASPAGESEAAAAAGAHMALGEAVDPPFAVAGSLEGLMLTWFDDEGPHSAANRDEIPEAHRDRVRVDSLQLPPEQRDGEHVFVADLRTAGSDGKFGVRRYTRESFDALVDEATGHGQEAEAATTVASVAGSDVIVYGTSWCGACRSAAQWLSQNNIPFEEKNVERDPGALAEMQRKARAAGIQPSGVPVIDARGTMLIGFDARALQRALETRTL